MGLLSNIFGKKTTTEFNPIQQPPAPTIDLTKKKEEVHTICLSKQPLNGVNYSGALAPELVKTSLS